MVCGFSVAKVETQLGLLGQGARRPSACTPNMAGMGLARPTIQRKSGHAPRATKAKLARLRIKMSFLRVIFIVIGLFSDRVIR